MWYNQTGYDGRVVNFIPGSCQINSYEQSQENNVTNDPNTQNRYKITQKEMAQIVAGRKFKLADKDHEVNGTYDKWVANLKLLVSMCYLSQYLADGFLKWNYYDRSENEGTKQDDVPDFFYPPYVI